jgi:hypothetical protein
MITLTQQPICPTTSARDRADASFIVPISLEMAEAGGRVAHRLLGDSEFLAKPNAAGELAARVYRVMRSLEPCHRNDGG